MSEIPTDSVKDKGQAKSRLIIRLAGLVTCALSALTLFFLYSFVTSDPRPKLAGLLIFGLLGLTLATFLGYYGFIFLVSGKSTDAEYGPSESVDLSDVLEKGRVQIDVPEVSCPIIATAAYTVVGDDNGLVFARKTPTSDPRSRDFVLAWKDLVEIRRMPGAFEFYLDVKCSNGLVFRLSFPGARGIREKAFEDLKGEFDELIAGQFVYEPDSPDAAMARPLIYGLWLIGVGVVLSGFFYFWETGGGSITLPSGIVALHKIVGSEGVLFIFFGIGALFILIGYIRKLYASRKVVQQTDS